MSLTDKVLAPIITTPAFDRIAFENEELGSTLLDRADANNVMEYATASTMRPSPRTRPLGYHVASAGDALSLVGLGYLGYGVATRNLDAIGYALTGFSAGRAFAAVPLFCALSRRRALREASEEQAKR